MKRFMVVMLLGYTIAALLIAGLLLVGAIWSAPGETPRPASPKKRRHLLVGMVGKRPPGLAEEMAASSGGN